MTADNKITPEAFVVRTWEESELNFRNDSIQRFFRMSSNKILVYGYINSFIQPLSGADAIRIPLEFTHYNPKFGGRLPKETLESYNRRSAFALYNSRVLNTIDEKRAYQALGASYRAIENNINFTSHFWSNDNVTSSELSVWNMNGYLPIDQLVQQIARDREWKIEPATLAELESLNQNR